MLRLNEDLVERLQFGKSCYQLNLSFDNVLTAYDALRDKELNVTDKLEVYLSFLIIGPLPRKRIWVELYNLIDQLLFSRNSTAKKVDLNGNPMPRPKQKPDFDFSFDASLIFAAFWQTYQIDLLKERGKLHWFKFIALLDGLPEDTRFCYIRQIRATDLAEIKDKEQKKTIRKQKQLFALPGLGEGGGEEDGGWDS